MSLIIKDVKESDGGKYTIIAENELGADTVEMNLIVQAPPKIKSKMNDISVRADIKVEVDVEVEGIPKPTVEFYKDGKLIKESERVKIVESGEKHTLVFEKSSLNDTGKIIQSF